MIHERLKLLLSQNRTIRKFSFEEECLWNEVIPEEKFQDTLENAKALRINSEKGLYMSFRTSSQVDFLAGVILQVYFLVTLHQHKEAFRNTVIKLFDPLEAAQIIDFYEINNG